MKDVNDGGPAFPTLTGRLANPLLLENMEQTGLPSEDIPKWTAKHCYAFADAMIAQRATPTKGAE